MSNLHHFFGSMISPRYSSKDEIDPLYVEKVWLMAENSQDVVLMNSILKLATLTPLVLTRAAAHKEASLRVSYLLREDTSVDTIQFLLGPERRSDVFAGLVVACKNNKVLSDILVAKMIEKPTKILAREMIRERIADPRAQIAALSVLSGDKNLPDRLISSKVTMIKNLLASSEHSSQMVTILTAKELVGGDYTSLSSKDLYALVVKLVSAARSHDERTLGRYYVRFMLDSLMAIANNPNTDEKTYKYMAKLSEDVWFQTALAASDLHSYCLQFQTIMSSSALAMSVSTVDEVYDKARTVKGAELAFMIDLALASKQSSMLEGLLENPDALLSDKFTEVVQASSPTNVVMSMSRTNSPELFKAIWREKLSGTPDKCWEYLLDADAVVVELSKSVYSSIGSKPTYTISRDMEALFAFTAPREALANMPWSVVCNELRYSPVLASAKVRNTLMQMQLESLGSSIEKWETFNNFALTWTETFGSLLDAAVAI